MPVGKPIDTLELAEYTAITILTDVLIHRDFRIKTVVLHDGRARLIDLGDAIKLPVPPDTPYWGRYFCCPPGIIGYFNLPYTPSKQHDLRAFIKLATLMAFSLHSLQGRKQAYPTDHPVEGFWAMLRTSSKRRPSVEGAER